MSGMKMVVQTVTHITISIIFMFGCYIAAFGHLMIGGGLAGGVIVALAFILYTLAFGESGVQERLNKNVASIIMSLGGTLFLLFVMLDYGIPKGKPGGLLSAGMMPFSNIALMMMVGAGLFLVFLNFVTFRVEARKEREDED